MDERVKKRAARVHQHLFLQGLWLAVGSRRAMSFILFASRLTVETGLRVIVHWLNSTVMKVSIYVNDKLTVYARRITLHLITVMVSRFKQLPLKLTFY
jgi:hypothetical protein